MTDRTNRVGWSLGNGGTINDFNVSVCMCQRKWNGGRENKGGKEIYYYL